MSPDVVVDRFTSLGELASVASRWMQLYETDSETSLFLSWDWINAAIATEDTRWLILGARDGDGPHVAFLPLRFDYFPPFGPALIRKLWLGVSARSDFTGILGVPGEEERFIPAFIREIETLGWDKFIVADCADRRIVPLVNAFLPNRYYLTPADSTPCPYVHLPETWEEYLSGRGYSTRRTIRSHLRKIESLPGYRLHFPAPDEADDAVETLLRIHSSRWGKDYQVWRKRFGGLLKRLFTSGRFGVAAMYQGQEVVAAQGFFRDCARRTIVAYMIGHNPEYAKFSPGTMLACASIRRAIEEGYRIYNFSRGDQPYKMSLSTGVEYITNATVWRRTLRAAAINAGSAGFSAAKRVARIMRGRGTRHEPQGAQQPSA